MGGTGGHLGGISRLAVGGREYGLRQLVRCDGREYIVERQPPRRGRLRTPLYSERRDDCTLGSSNPVGRWVRESNRRPKGDSTDEAAQVLIGDLSLPHVAGRDTAWVLIRGKGNKSRRCPLWARTVDELTALVQGRDPSEHVFLNRCGRPITRFGIHTLVERTVTSAVKQVPSLSKKRVSPHTIRHTTATHLLRSGVDINTIRAWLGHVSLTTTNVYAEVDLEMKAKALANCQIADEEAKKAWREDKGLMAFLKEL